jgi:hypothetical protein
MNPYTTQDLDDTIDRVASALTAVTADDTLAARVVSQLDQRRLRFSLLVWAVPTAAAVAILAVTAGMLMRSQVEDASDSSLIVGVLPARELTVRSVLAAPSVATDHGATVAHRPGAASFDLIGADEPTIPQITALNEPRGLVVGELPADALVIAPVDIELLALPDLRVDAIAEDNPKE